MRVIELFERSAGPACPSDLRLDRWLAGELAGAEAQALLSHVGECLPCHTRRGERERERAAFRADAPRLRLPRRHRRWAAPAATLGALAAAALVLALRPTGRAPETGGPTRLKGGPRLGAFVKHGDRVRGVLPGDEVAPGDALRFTLTAAKPGYVALLGRDGSGRAAVYTPGSVPIAAGDAIELPVSLVLDATPGAETFVAVVCPAPFDPEPLRAALAGGDVLPEGPGCRRDRLDLDKRGGP